MTRSFKLWMACAFLGAVLLTVISAASGQDSDGGPQNTVTQKGFWDFLKAGGIVGYTIIALSFLSAGLVIDSFVHIKQDKLFPEALVEQADVLARKGRFSEIVTLCKASESLISRVIEAGLSQGGLGLTGVRQAMQEHGVKEFARLNQRVGYMGFIGSVGPMLGLLGTVLGMVSSFHVLGSSKGAARPDELAQGISYALVTTCEGLILAIPMMFFHNFFRDRVSKLSQECSSVCERMLRVMTAVMEARVAASKTAGRPAETEVAVQVVPPGVSPAQGSDRPAGA